MRDVAREIVRSGRAAITSRESPGSANVDRAWRIYSGSGWKTSLDCGVREAIEAGFDRHIAKPASIDDVERLLADAGRRESDA
jgi:hypothetical protein